MCGIVGIINTSTKAVSESVLRAMTSAMLHRGPDDHGTYINKNIGLGHRRLSILDLSPLGKQPMISNDHRYVLTFNGEIYNFRELRAELETAGFQFTSTSDTEVLLYGYAHWKEALVSRLNGMFAFAIWDNQTKELFIARDRYGIKPLYICQTSSSILFASEIKAFIPHPEFKVTVDKDALIEYFTFQNFLSEKTLFQGVHLVPAGHYLKLKDGSGTFEKTQYWDFDFQEPTVIKTEAEYVEELRHLFRQSVGRQLVSDVEVGAYLSGGIDSGSIASVASTQLDHFKTFTCGFDLHSANGLEMAFDERELAEYLSYVLKSEQYEIVLKAGDMERILPRLTYHLEEPRVGQSYPNMYIAGLASKFVKVVLSGSGGDEIFGGYPWRYYKAAQNQDFDEYAAKYYQFWQRLVPDNSRTSFFSPLERPDAAANCTALFRSIFPQGTSLPRRPEDYINLSLYFEAKTFLNGLLIVEDKLSMSHSLETRLPFLDNDLVDFAMKLPVSMKLNNLQEVLRIDENDVGPNGKTQFQRSSDGKHVLRKAMSSFVPKKILEGKKQGFSAPDASWFRGESIEFVQRKLLRKDSPIYEYLDQETVHELVADHLDGRQNRRLLVWSLLNFNEWCHQFLKP